MAVRNLLEDENYWDMAFQNWYSANCPKELKVIRSVMPDTDEPGNKPAFDTIKKAMEVFGWAARADVLNAKANEQTEMALVQKKVDLLNRQAADSRDIANLAKDYLLEHGFDTSASAVAAYFKATEEERTIRGVSDMLVRVSRMTPEQLEDKAMKLLRRRAETENASVDGEILEESDASSGSEASD